MILPTWIECLEAHHCGKHTALTKFIYENEPSGGKEEIAFREGLRSLIIEIKNDVRRGRYGTISGSGDNIIGDKHDQISND